MFVARCPKCATELDVDDADAGYRVACPSCGTSFVAILPPPLPRSPELAEDRRPTVRRWNDDSDYENETAVPPRHWIDREDDRGVDPLRVVRRELAGPANGLISVGWIGFVLMLVGGFLAAISGFVEMNSPYARGEGPIFRLVFGAIAATIGSLYFAMIATGGNQMKRVRKRGQAISTAVLGILTLAFCLLPASAVQLLSRGGDYFPHILLVAALLIALSATGFGVRALVVLNRPEVVDAFARRAKKG